MDASPEKLVDLFSSMIYNASKGFVEINVEKKYQTEKGQQDEQTNQRGGGADRH